ncbi:hypothetical protein ZEAMMB73_Zm00001d002524 [Zea mays]|nr:hypothetical protein ZEAMMB73_Zm00001d002524 [Zea mays]
MDTRHPWVDAGFARPRAPALRV